MTDETLNSTLLLALGQKHLPRHIWEHGDRCDRSGAIRESEGLHLY